MLNLKAIKRQLDLDYTQTMIDLVESAPKRGEPASSKNYFLREKACALRDAKLAIDQMIKIEAKTEAPVITSFDVELEAAA